MNRGWIVTFSGMGLNIALGVLYAWSVFAKQLTEPLAAGGFGWNKTLASLPYTTAIAVFAVMMIPAGRLQDRFGPRLVATSGALLTGLGLMVAGLATPEASLPALLGFGVLAGAGIGLGYSSTTPAAVKWFPPERKGLITGLVVSGFGVAPVIIAPLSNYLLGEYGVGKSFMILGAAFAVFAGLLAQMLVNPAVAATSAKTSGRAAPASGSWRDMLGTAKFYILWLQYACAAMAGLMIIGHLSRIVATQSGGAVKAGYLFVGVLAVFNASGRIVAGIVSDKIGRVWTIALVCVMQAATMSFFGSFATSEAFFIGASLVGFSYGACLSLFPAVTADNWGTANFGLNYGIIFTAWGVGGVFGPLLAGRIADSTGSYTAAYEVASMLMIAAALLSLVLKYLQKRKGAVPA
ncbi:MAG: OFA family MFS transporter [Desulfovibrio sp.]|nr:OFA family MFS transporter [Desulfovibrio sp.]MBI4958022.1 OFA family MFS transporter [Desulfovibrio sp.]